MNQRKSGALLSYVYLALTLVVGLVYTPFSLHYLGESGYGVFAVATSAISFLAILDLGFNQTMIRYVAKYKALGDAEGEERLNGLFLIFYLIIAAVSLVAGVVLSFFIEDIFASGTSGFTTVEAENLKIIFAILLVNLVVSFPLGIYTAILNANEGFVFLKLANIVTFVLTYGGMSIALISGGKVISMAIITTVVSILVKAVQAVYVQKTYRVRFRFGGYDDGLIQEVFSFSFFIFLNIVIDQLYANTDKFILGIVKGSYVVTVYTVGVQFSSYFEQFSTSISGVFLPRITKLVTTEKNMKKVSDIFVRIGRIQFILLSLLMSGFIVFGRQFIALWVGADKLEAYAIALVIIIPAMIPLSQNIGISVIRAMNMHRFRSLVYIVIAVINVLLSIPLAYKFGGFGAACATGFGTLLGQIITMNWFYYKKIGLDVPRYWKEVLKIFAISVPVCVIGWLITLIPVWRSITSMRGWLSLLIQCIIYTIIYSAVAWLFIFNKYEKGLVTTMLKKIAYILLKLIPLRDDVMLESHPDFSDNTYVIYRELLKRKYNINHRIYWCIYDESKVQENLPANVYCVYQHKPGIKAKINRYIAVARCRYIIDSNAYIHKLKKKQIRLHLGHGMPIKLIPEYTNYDKIGVCDGYLTCGMYWQDIYTNIAKIPEDVLLPIGYPRNDVLVPDSETGKIADENSTPSARKPIRKSSKTRGVRGEGYLNNIHKKENYILWMPTYRQHKNDHIDDAENTKSLRKTLEEGETLPDENDMPLGIADEDRWEVFAMKQLRSKRKTKMPFGMPEIKTADQLEAMDKKLGEYGLMVYYRPHPAQDMFYVTEADLMNVRIVDDNFLKNCGASLYEVIRASKALITDYSSVYFDYLLTDKPIGLTIRDWGTFFRDCICVFDNIEKELAGAKLNSFKDVMGFIDGVASSMDISDEQAAKKKFHDVTDGSSTERVMAWLREQGMPVDAN